jgi:hypothetical protein
MDNLKPQISQKPKTSQNLQNIKEMYDKLTYMDQYGGSVILLFIFTIILLIFASYCAVMINTRPIIDDWPNQRCKPQIMPIAGFITHPDGMTAIEYTYQNFNYCLQNILSSGTGTAVAPLTFVTSALQSIAVQVQNDIQNIRGMFDKIRNSLRDVTQEIMGRIMNITIPLQQMIVVFKDVISKVQGTMTAGLFTVLGSYYTLKSLLGAIIQMVIVILISLAVTIAVLWAVPFTWGAAISATVFFALVAIPLVIIQVFLSNALHMQGGQVPKVKCFDEDTLITMNDGTRKKIIDIKVGDILIDDNEVTATFKLEAAGSTMYYLENVTVSNSHVVMYKDQWIHVSEHPDAIKHASYQKPHLYCLNTANKIIEINGIIFTDWDELNGDDISELKNNGVVRIDRREDIHTQFDSGFAEKTSVKLANGTHKEIRDICVGDVLERGETVYGLVKINGKNISDQFTYTLGNTVVEGGPNLPMCDKKVREKTTLYLESNRKKKLTKNHDELYHLLTDKKTFYVDKVKFYDYNATVDLFLVKTAGKLLSMKYV